MAPPHALFQSVEELQLIPGMTQELYRRIAPLLTVYSQTPWIDPALSSVAVLTVLSAVDSSAEAALRRLEEERLGVRPPAANPGVVLGHAYTITAELHGAAAARVVRTAIVRVTGQPRAPLLIYRWS
jgi:general secretion pathway protein K